MQKNMISGNTFHHAKMSAGCDANAIRLVTLASGFEITGSSFYGFRNAVYIQGGHLIDVHKCDFHASSKAVGAYLKNFGEGLQNLCNEASENYINAMALGIMLKYPCKPSENWFQDSCVCKPVVASNYNTDKWSQWNSTLSGNRCEASQRPAAAKL